MDPEGYIQIVDRTKDLDEPPGKDEIFDLLREKIAKWQLPDDIVFVEAIPKTSVGKFDKKVLRAEYVNYRLPETR